MQRRHIYGLLLYSLSASGLYAAPILGTASSFSVLGASTVTNTGATVLSGDLGLYAGTSITGFPPGIVNGTTHTTDAVAQQAQADALAAYNSLISSPSTQDLTGQNLGGLTLTPGVYTFSSSAQLTGTLTLNPVDSSSVFVFVIGSTLTTASASSVIASNGAACCNVYWVIESSATLGTGTQFLGNILAHTSITLNNGASITDGGAFALTGAVTLDTNNISSTVCNTASGVPEPGSVVLLVAGLFGLVLVRRTSRKRAA